LAAEVERVAARSWKIGRAAYRLPERALPIVLALPTIGLTLFCVIGWKFDGLYGQDPYGYFNYGVGPLRHLLTNGTGLAAMVWPLGYPFLISISSLVAGPTTNAAQSVSLLAAAACVGLTYLFGRDALIFAGAGESLARRAGALAAILFGVTGWTIESGALIMADSTALAASLLSAWALLRWELGSRDDSAGSAWMALAGGALAFSAVTRWGQLALFPVWVLALVWAGRTRHVPVHTPEATAGRSLHELVMAAPWALIPAALIVGVQLLLTFTVPAAPHLGVRPFAGNFGLLGGGGWSPIHLAQSSFLNADGSQHYSLPNALFYASAAFRPIYLTPLFALPALAGAWLVAAKYRRAAPWLLGWPFVVLLLDAGLAEQNIRFVLAALPPIAVLAALGVAAAWDRIPRNWIPTAAVTLAASLVVVATAGLRDVHGLVVASRGDLAVASWAASQVPPRTTLVSFEITQTLAHSTRLRPLDLFYLSIGDLRRVVRERPTYLLVRVASMTGQWYRKTPGIDFRYLQHALGMSRLGERGGYSLFKLARP
jgi:hypothetical protein